jgi:hypothetical protein
MFNPVFAKNFLKYVFFSQKNWFAFIVNLRKIDLNGDKMVSGIYLRILTFFDASQEYNPSIARLQASKQATH